MHTLKDYYFLRFGGSFFRKVKDLKNWGYIFNDPRRRVLSLDPPPTWTSRALDPPPARISSVPSVGEVWIFSGITHSVFNFFQKIRFHEFFRTKKNLFAFKGKKERKHHFFRWCVQKIMLGFFHMKLICIRHPYFPVHIDWNLILQSYKTTWFLVAAKTDNK